MTPQAVESCARCNGTGWLLRAGPPSDCVVPCPECRAALRLEHLLQQAAIPPRYFDRGFDVYSIHTARQEHALKRSIDYVESFPEVDRGLLFVGPCGVGKTHLSVAVLKSLILEKLVVGRFVDETELLRRLQYSYTPGSPETEREVLLPLMKADLLVWDDLGSGRPTEWVKETMRTVLNYRYTYEKPTLFSTNFALPSFSPSSGAPEDGLLPAISREQNLSERIGRRLFSRVMEMCEVVQIEGPDFRIETFESGRNSREAPAPPVPSSQVSSPVTVPPGLLSCPRCKTTQVEQQDYSGLRGSGLGSYFQIFCHCGQCEEPFIAHFYPKSARIEFPPLNP